MSPGPHWRALQTEAQLAGQQIAVGVTALGKANHAQRAYYAQAFFGLSIGIERLGKLIFVADHVIHHNAAFPADRELRDIGHDLCTVLDRCERIGGSYDKTRNWPDRPNNPIVKSIEKVLSEFSNKTRYYNLNFVVGASGATVDPIKEWWVKVAEPICQRHLTKRQMIKYALDAAALAPADNFTLMRNEAEDGAKIDNFGAACAHGCATRVAQRYGPFYTLQLVRWLGSLLYEIQHEGAYKKGIDFLVGMHEPFIQFVNSDAFLKSRRTWKIYNA